MRRAVSRLALVASLVAGLTACALGVMPSAGAGSTDAQAWVDAPRYYWQAIRGHLSLWWRAKPVERVIDDPGADPRLVERLALAVEMRRFASEQLGLPDNRSYTQYVDLGRAHVVWNVKAAAEFSLEPRRWCFPVAGCVAYKGFYDRNEAEAFAARLRAQGDDVLVSGVPAYSTLGWMSDPLLNTFIHYPEPDLAGLIFHELAHQRLYLKGDTRFNESFATAVEIIGVQRWLEHRAARGMSDVEDMRMLTAWQARRERREQFIALLTRARERLEAIYEVEGADRVKRAGKQEAIAALRADWQALRARWGQGHGYDRWFDQDIGNAHLVSVALYTDWVPALLSMVDRQRGDLVGFYRDVEDLARLPSTERTERLIAMTESAQQRSVAAITRP